VFFRGIIEASPVPFYISLCYRHCGRIHSHSDVTLRNTLKWELTFFYDAAQSTNVPPGRYCDIIQNDEDSGGAIEMTICVRAVGGGRAALVLCERSQHSARFYPTGAAHRTEPCSHWRRKRRGEEGRGVVLWKSEKLPP